MKHALKICDTRTSDDKTRARWSREFGLDSEKSEVWVAKIGLSDGKMTREFLDPFRDISAASKDFKLGVIAFFWADEQHVYEVCAPKWPGVERYFCRVTGTGTVVRFGSKGEACRYIISLSG